MDYNVAVISDQNAKKFAKAGKRAFVYEPQSIYYAYPGDVTGLSASEYSLETISAQRNDELSEVTYDAVAKTFPIIKGRKMY